MQFNFLRNLTILEPNAPLEEWPKELYEKPTSFGTIHYSIWPHNFSEYEIICAKYHW